MCCAACVRAYPSCCEQQVADRHVRGSLREPLRLPSWLLLRLLHGLPPPPQVSQLYVVCSRIWRHELILLGLIALAVDMTRFVLISEIICAPTSPVHNSYRCCQDFLCKDCKDCCCCGMDQSCPELCNCLEVPICSFFFFRSLILTRSSQCWCCYSWHISATRIYVQVERQIITDPCDNRLIVSVFLSSSGSQSHDHFGRQIFNNYLQILKCICNTLALIHDGFRPIAQCVEVCAVDLTCLDVSQLMFSA
jgi:hypothetical protein